MNSKAFKILIVVSFAQTKIIKKQAHKTIIILILTRMLALLSILHLSLSEKYNRNDEFSQIFVFTAMRKSCFRFF